MHKDWSDALYVSLGANVRERRQQLQLGQAEVADRMGLTRASISNLEAGRQRPQVHQVYALATILQTTVEALLPQDVLPPDVDEDRSRHEALERRLVAAAERNA